MPLQSSSQAPFEAIFPFPQARQINPALGSLRNNSQSNILASVGASIHIGELYWFFLKSLSQVSTQNESEGGTAPGIGKRGAPDKGLAENPSLHY